MARIRFAICALSGALLCGAVQAQGPGGGCGGGQGSPMTGTSLAGMRMGRSQAMTGGVMLTQPGSFAYDQIASQMVAQRLAQQQYMLAVQQQQARQEKRTAMRERAEKLRAQTTESRDRTRAYLAAQNGLKPASSQAATLVANRSIGR
jgi:hypothetical protein